MSAIDPVVMFFALGIFAGIARADIKLPAALYESISLFLLLSIGLKGGIELARQSSSELLFPLISVMLAGVAQTVLGYGLLRFVLRVATADAAAIAAHYGSVSVGTYAVVSSYLTNRHVAYEPHMPVFVVALEIPAIIVGVLLAKGRSLGGSNTKSLLHELFLGKGVVLLVGGLLIGWAAGPKGMAPYLGFFVGGFKGVLALFLLEMGLLCAGRISDLRSKGVGLLLFAILMPLLGGLMGATLGPVIGLSIGGTAVLATLLASASYIAVPAAMRMMVPEANPTLSLGAALGVTFPFNVTLGIPLYVKLSTYLHGVLS